MATPRRQGASVSKALVSAKKSARAQQADALKDLCTDFTRLKLPRLRAPASVQKPHPFADTAENGWSPKKATSNLPSGETGPPAHADVSAVEGGGRCQDNTSQEQRYSDGATELSKASMGDATCLEAHSSASPVTMASAPEMEGNPDTGAGATLGVTPDNRTAFSPVCLDNEANKGSSIQLNGLSGASLCQSPAPSDAECRGIENVGESTLKQGAAEEEDDVPLACHTAINKRRTRGQHGQQRYGEWFTGSEVELDTTLLEYNRVEAVQISNTATRTSNRRKSAFPSLAHGSAQENAEPGNKASSMRPRERWTKTARNRRRTIAPGQGLSGVAAEVATISEELESLADSLLPSEDAKKLGKRETAADASLAERLKKAWNGQSYYDRLVTLAAAEEESSSSSAQGPAELSVSHSAPSALEPSSLSDAPAKPSALPSQSATSDPTPTPGCPVGPSMDAGPSRAVLLAEKVAEVASAGKGAVEDKPLALRNTSGGSAGGVGINTTAGVSPVDDGIAADSGPAKGRKPTTAEKTSAAGAKAVRFASNPVYSPGASADSGAGSHVAEAGADATGPRRVMTPRIRGTHRPPTPAKLKLQRHNKENGPPDVGLTIQGPGPVSTKGSTEEKEVAIQEEGAANYSKPAQVPLSPSRPLPAGRGRGRGHPANQAAKATPAKEDTHGLRSGTAVEQGRGQAARPSNASKDGASRATTAADEQSVALDHAKSASEAKGVADPAPAAAQDAPMRAQGGGGVRSKGIGGASRAEKTAQRQAVEATVELDQARAALEAAKKRAARAEADAASEAKARKAAERQVRELRAQLEKERSVAATTAIAHSAALEVAAREYKAQLADAQSRIAAARADGGAALTALSRALKSLS